jgi:hypothetical protein
MIQGDAIGILVAMIHNQSVVDRNSLPVIDTAISLKYRCLPPLLDRMASNAGFYAVAAWALTLPTNHQPKRQ